MIAYLIYSMGLHIFQNLAKLYSGGAKQGPLRIRNTLCIGTANNLWNLWDGSGAGVTWLQWGHLGLEKCPSRCRQYAIYIVASVNSIHSLSSVHNWIIKFLHTRCVACCLRGWNIKRENTVCTLHMQTSVRGNDHWDFTGAGKGRGTAVGNYLFLF